MDTIALSLQDVEELRKQYALIESQERILSALKSQMYGLIEKKYGVDLATETWELDLTTGQLHGKQ